MTSTSVVGPLTIAKELIDSKTNLNSSSPSVIPSLLIVKLVHAADVC